MRAGTSMAVALAMLGSGCMAHQAAAGAAAAAGPPAAAAKPVAEAPRYGAVSFPVSCSPEAQRQFDLAVGALHSFFYPETVKAFQRVLEIDPGCAMAYWGIARSQPPNPLVLPFPPGTYQRGLEAIAKGKALGPGTQRERDWLDAAEAYFGDPDAVPYRIRATRYQRAMERLSQRYPDDTEAAVFHALALLESADPHDKSYDQQFKAAGILKALEAGHPNHPGITHYLIHAYDYSPIAGQGLPAANEYARIAPSAPHAVHMPSHIYSMLGMWTPSIESNQATLVIARAYAAKSLPAGVTYAGEPHSLDFMEYAYLQLGRDREAREVAAAAAAITKANVPTVVVDAALAAIPARYALERGAWAEAAALAPRPSAYPYAEAIPLFGRAVGAARLGDPGHAQAARADIGTMREVRARYLAMPGQEYWLEQTEVLIDAASGWLAHAQRDDAEAVRLLRKAADLEDASEKHVAMENRLLPVREQLGYLLLEMGTPERALAEFEAALKSTPNRLRGLYGAAKAAEHAGRLGVAREYYRRLRELTAGADGQRPEIDEARAFLAAR